MSKNQLEVLFKDAQSYLSSTDTNLVDLLVDAKIAPSKREARQLISSNAIRINGNIVNDVDFTVSKSDAIEETLTIIRRGRRHYYVVNHS